jgi:hypothetical protein
MSELIPSLRGMKNIKIDCNSCVMKDISCHDCVVTFLLDQPQILEKQEIKAFQVLANSGLVPPLRHVSG